MAIQFEKYVRITSGVVGNVGVRQRELIGRLFTEHPAISPDEVLEFTDLDDIKAFFGMDSEEYKRAQYVLGWISKQATRPRKISFARYAKDAVFPAIYGGTGAKNLDSLTGITYALQIRLDGNLYATGNIDLSGAVSFSDCANLIQAAIQVEGNQLANATVEYDAIKRRFILTLEGAIGSKIEIIHTPLAYALEWTKDKGAISINGMHMRSPAETLSDSAEITSNFGAFAFIADLTDEEIAEIAAWNDAQNIKYFYCVKAHDKQEAQLRFGLLAGFAGVAVTLAPKDKPGYPELLPMAIMSATDYTRRNSTCNYMFQVDDRLKPAVTTTTDSNKMDSVRYNYYGVTQTAGQYRAFYQRGVLMGGAKAPVDMNVYANEVWLKDMAGTQILSLLLSLQKVSANERGRAQIINILLPCIEAALYNGVVSVGKPLTPIQKAFVTEETGDELAWQQVQDKGYWLNCWIRTETTTDGRTEYYAAYILIYSKDDVIRRVEGSHELI